MRTRSATAAEPVPASQGDSDATVRAKLEEMALQAALDLGGNLHYLRPLAERIFAAGRTLGRAEGAREERDDLAGLVDGFIRERERKVTAGAGTKTIIELRVLRQVAAEYARRGQQP